MKVAGSTCAPKEMGAEDPLFILYTSGSTGKPKGVLHTTGGYLVYASLTHERVFDYRPGEVYWCTADIGWVTGHTYIVYGPLANGATTILFEGVPNYPDVTRVAKIIDKHKVNILYTAPTAIRAMMAEGKAAVAGADGSSLRLLGSVGEPINPEAWQWYYETVGQSRCPIVDTWWQTETGASPDDPLPGAHAMKPGSAAAVLRRGPGTGGQPRQPDRGRRRGQPGDPRLLAGPGARTLFGDHDRFVDTYFKTFKGMYFTGDGARRDEDGYYWITGGSTTCSTSPATAWAPPRWKARWSLTRRSPRRRWSACSTTSRGRASMSTSPSTPGRAERGAAPGAEAMGSPRDRSDRHAGCDPVGAGTAEDPFGQDHAAHPAQDRRGRVRHPRRHLHPLPTRAWSST